MWRKGILGDDDSQSLLDTMLFMNDLYFALCDGKEHRQLRHHPLQIELIEKPGERAYVIYVQRRCFEKSPRGLKNRKIKPKIVMYHANLENPKRCFV